MFDIELTDHPNFTSLRCKGPGTLENFKGLLDAIQEGRFNTAVPWRYLIDLRGLEGTIGTTERYEIGKYLAERVARHKIAAISKPESYNKVAENVAVNRGANVLSTEDENFAREWLLSD